MKSKKEEKLDALLKKYLPSSDSPSREFCATLRGADREKFKKILDGEEIPDKEEVLTRCIQILSVRLKSGGTPYGFYDKK